MNMCFPRYFILATLGLALFVVSGCSGGTMGKIGKILSDPSLEVGPLNERASTASITIYAEPNANRTDYGEAPVDVWVFEMTDPDELMASDFMSLVSQPTHALGTSYVKHHKKQVLAGRSTMLAPFELDKKTTYIGIAAGFAKMDGVSWRAAARVNPKGEQYSILAPITQKGVGLQIHR